MFTTSPHGTQGQARLAAESTDLPGAYGLRIEGLASAGFLQPCAPGEWPAVRLVRRTAENPPAPTVWRMDDDRAELTFGHGEGMVIDRATSSVAFTTRAPLSDDAVAHPYLVLPAAVFGRWAGREAFHAGSFVAGGRAWGVFGHKGYGKSSTLGWLAGAGYDVLTDDLVLLDGDTVLPGPRCVDLRAEASARLGVGAPLGVVGSRERFRLSLPPAQPTPLAGLIFLAWGASVEVERLPAAEALSRLFQYEALEVGPVQTLAYLDLASLPAWELRRPRTWDSFAAATAALLEAVAGAR